MATKKKFKPPQYYAYYSIDSGDVIGVTHLPDETRAFIPIKYEYACAFFAGTDNYSNYAVSLVNKRGKQVLDLVQKQIITRTVVIRSFNRIYESANAQELIVEWNLPNKTWVINLNTTDVENVSSRFIFYIVSESNFNQIVRTIELRLQDLLDQKRIEVSFKTTTEADINNITILTKMTLSSYGLKITHD
jgi:hypothetical protein